ncbi:MAG: ribonuclease Z [Thaumarchaeota archaeon]|nr:ribonuclease Z [Nitrososphaerota archaeon]
MGDLKLVFLGTSSAVPTKDRGLSSIAVLRKGEVLLFDAGEGVQRAMMKAGIGFGGRMRVFITHMHGDHCLGLIGMLQTMGLLGREKLLELYGPRGLLEFVESNVKMLHYCPPFPISFKEVREGVVLDAGEYVVKAHPALHSIPSFSYVLEEKERPGVFYPDKAVALGVPRGRLWHELQHGRPVRVGDRVIRPEQVTGPKRPGRKIGISGDTRPTEGLVEFFRGCDVLVFESTYDDSLADRAVENLHSTAREAAEVARESGVGKLVLYHFSPRYRDVGLLVEQAREVFPNVVAAEDLMTLEVPLRS